MALDTSNNIRPEVKEILDSLVGYSDDVKGIAPIDLRLINLCDPDGSPDSLAMPYPDRPSDFNIINDIINGDDINSLIGGEFRPGDLIKDTPDWKTVQPYIGKIPDLDQPIIGIGATPEEIQSAITNPNLDVSINMNPDELYPIENYAIVEFGDDYTLGDKVDYELAIQPGQSLNNDTIIGSIVQQGIWKPIKSIFQRATVMKTESNDFFHLFPTSCDRHFILTDFEYGTQTDFKDGITGITEYYNNAFKTNSMLFMLIKDNMIYSLLPKILQKRESLWEYRVYSGYYVLATLFQDVIPTRYPSGIEHYNEYIDKFDQFLLDWNDRLQKRGGADIIRQTNGNYKKMEAISNDLVKLKDEFIKSTVEFYNNVLGTFSKCGYDFNFTDCRFLAQSKHGKLDDSAAIGIHNMFNYYLNLISKVDLQWKDEWHYKYYNVLKRIIHNRIQKERYSLAQMISEFNQLYKNNLSRFEEDGFHLLNDTFKNKVDLEYTDVVNYLVEHGPTSNNKTTNYKLQSSVTQMANIYMFIRDYQGEYVEDMAAKTSNQDIYDLVVEEDMILHNFWEEAIKAYFDNPVESIIQSLKEWAKSYEVYAEWPMPTQFSIQGITYNLFEFCNRPEVVKPFAGDFDGANQQFTKDTPTIPTSAKKPSQEEAQEAFDNGLATQESDNDPKESEITIMDYQYWVVYFSLATVISVGYLADGFDVPPYMTPTPMPGIYICFACIPIKMLNIILVIGLAIRGIWFWPIILFVNISSQFASVLTPLIVAVEKIHELFSAKIEKLEMLIPNIAQLLINNFEQENYNLRKQNNEYETYILTLQNQAIENKALIKRGLIANLKEGVTFDNRQVITRLEKLSRMVNETKDSVASIPDDLKSTKKEDTEK